MIICPNLSNKEVKEEFNKLVNALGENLAYLVWNRNNGNFIDKTSDGSENKNYTKAFIENKGNDIAAIVLASKNLLENNDSINSKSTDLIDMGKSLLNNIFRGYGMNNKGQFKITEDRAISLNNALQAAGLKDVSVVQTNSGYQLYDRTLKKDMSLKDIKQNDKYVLSASDITNSIQNRIVDELKKLGVTIELQQDLQKKYGIDALAVADIVERSIRFSKNEIDVKELGEEGAHFFIEALTDTPFLNRLMNNLETDNYYIKILGDEYSQYNTVYNGDINKLKKEAAGKLLGQYLVSPNTITSNSTKSLLKRVWDYLKGMFNNRDTSSLRNLIHSELEQFAKDILLNKASNIKVANLYKSTVDKLFSINERAETLKEIFEKVLITEGLRLKIFKGTKKIKSVETQKKMILILDKALKENTVKEKFCEYLKSRSDNLRHLIRELEKEGDLTTRTSISSAANIARRMNSMVDSIEPIIKDTMRYINNNIEDTAYNKELDTIATELMKAANTARDDINFKMFNIFAKWIGLEFEEFAHLKNPFGETMTKDQILQTIKVSSRDNNYYNRWLSGSSDNPDIIINLVAKALRNSEHDIRMKVQENEYKLRESLKKLREAGINNTDFLYELDEKGIPTQNFISEWDYSGYENAKKELLDKLRNSFPVDNKDQLNALLATDDSKMKEWSKEWRRFNGKWKTNVIGWENIMKSKQTSLSEYEFLKWKARNVKENINFEGKVSFSPSIYGELAHPKIKNKKFQELIKDSNKKQFYDIVHEIMKESINLLPANIGLHPHIAPRISAELRERVVQSGVKGIFSGKDYLSSFVVRADEDLFGDLYEERMQDFSGKEVQFLPIYYTRKLEGATFSKDVMGTVLQFNAMAVNYDIKSQMLDILEVGKDVLSERLVEIGDNGLETKTTVSLLNRTVQRRANIKAKKLLESYSDLLNRSLYGKSEVESGSITLSLGKKSLSVSKSKLTNVLRDMVTFVNLAGSPLVGATNGITGEVSILGEAVSGRYFNIKDRQFAIKEMFKLIPSYMQDIGSVLPNSRLWHLMYFFNTLGEFDQHLKGIDSNVKNKLLRAATMDSFMAFISSTDFMSKLSVCISLLHSTKVLNKEGKTVSLYDQFEIVDNKGRIKEGTKNLDKTDFTSQDLKAFLNRQSKLNSQLFGIAERVDKSAASSRNIGKLLMIFRSFMPHAINRRFSKNKFDASLGAYTEGYYITAFKFLQRDLAEANWQLSTAWNHLSDEQRMNLKLVIFDLVVFSALWMIYGGLGMLDDDDPRIDAIRLLAVRTRTELAALSPIGIFGETTQILKSPTALMGLIDSATNALGSATNILTFGETYEKGPFKDFNKTMIKSLRLLPGNRIVFDFLTVDEKLKWYGVD